MTVDRRRLLARYPHRPVVYYADLLLSATLAWGSMALSAAVPFVSIANAGLLLVSSLALLRAVYFVHEIVHLPAGAVPGFSVVWHVVVGIPSLVPRFMADAHLHHHSPSTYGTAGDPEYAPVPAYGIVRLAFEVAVLVLAPPLLVARFAVASPISWTCPPLRRFVVARLSTLATQPGYIRPLPRGRAKLRMIASELACFATIVIVAALVVRDVIPLRVVLAWWIAAGLALSLNQVRTFVAHAYEGTGAPMPFEAQISDTITIGGSLAWTELIAPLGTRYHAIHHLVPSLPYHALGSAHAEVLAEAPAHSPFRDGLRVGLWSALVVLVRRARVASRSSRAL